MDTPESELMLQVGKAPARLRSREHLPPLQRGQLALGILGCRQGSWPVRAGLRCAFRFGFLGLVAWAHGRGPRRSRG